jgi:hypothetical protein
VAAVTTAAFTLAGFPARASAQEPPVAVDQAALGEQLFAALTQIRDGGHSGLAHMLLSAEVLEWRLQHSWASAQEVTAHFAGRQQALAGALGPQDRALPEAEFAIRVVKALLATEPGTAAAAPHIRFLLESTLGRSLAAFDTREDLTTGSLRTGQWLRGKGEGEARIWAAVRRQALEDAGFAQAWNTVIGAPISLDATAPFDVLKSDPTLQSYIDVDAILALQASRAAFLAEARRQFGLVADRLLQESQQARARLVQLSTTCPVGLNTMTCTPEQRAAATATAKEEQKEIDAAAAAANVLGGLVALTDLKAGQKLQKVASALFSIVTAINKYATAVAGRSAQDAIFSAAAFGLTGDIFGAVMTLMGLFGESGPSLDQQILEQVAALRQEVRDLHQEMRQSFQRIEAQLNTIFEAMMTEFGKLTLAVAGNTAALIDIQNALAEQELRLEEVAATILTAIGDVELHDARVDVNHYIGYAQTYGQEIPSFGEYTDPENEFHYAATEASTHSAFVVPAAWASDSTVQPADVLQNFGEAKAISYLARLAHFRDPAVPDPLNVVANPGVWNFGAQAYSLLQLQNPGYAEQVSPLRTELIALEGQRILEAARSLSQPAATPDAVGNRTNAVFTSLLQEYREALARLSTRMAAVRTQQIVVRDEPGGVFPVPKTYALFGAVNQSIPDSTLPADPATVRACSSGYTPVARPSNVTFRTLAPELRFAHYAFSPQLTETARLPKLSLCYDAAWIGERDVVSSFSIDTYARLRLTMRTRFQWDPDQPWRNGRSATYTWPEGRMARECVRWSCTDDFYTSPEEALTARWALGKSVFEQSATITTDTALLTEVRTTMTAFLQGRQRALYDLIATGIRDANTELNGAVKDMNNAARQLQAYTRLGFPIALAADEILSSVLFGQYPIPVNMGGQPQLDITYNIALNNYACAPGAAPGTPCFGGTFYPLRSQPFLETVGGTTGTSPVGCAVSTFWVPGLPGDAVGDCLIASAKRRLDALTLRYRHHSQLLADGVYVEQLPWVSSTLDTLSLVDTLVRTEPTN